MFHDPAQRWTDLGEGVLVRQSSLYQMNSAALLDTDHTVLMDPGILPSELDDIAAMVAAIAPRRITLLYTHAHWDHILGDTWWPGADCIAHDRFEQAFHEGRAHIEAEAARVAREAGETWPRALTWRAPNRTVSGQRFERFGDWRIVLRDAFGHSDSQLSAHLPELGMLFAADMLSDIEIPILHAPPAVYRGTLEALRPIIEGGAIHTLVPGHGSVARGVDAARARLARDLAYLDALEAGVRAAHARGDGPGAAIEALADLPDVERDPGTPMRDIHHENIRIAYTGSAAATR